MTRHHNKKSFLSQTKYDIQMRARAIEHRRKTTMYGNAQGKIKRKDTMYERHYVWTHSRERSRKDWRR
ncbi:unnamed protein product [Rhizophagus irregularis]|uniref:Uncharacterized protein n=1 Tax=Rhizophagus irregularis TaxID=588596 RepID=A0A915YWA8_9GLOM|nr:unnamed protein product [Rhizophagus irregularis]